MDFLGSILSSMEKPPSVGSAEKKKVQEQQKLIEKQQEAEKKKLQDFREKIQKKIHAFIKDPALQKYKFEPMEKVLRAIVHEVADVAGLAAFSFGLEEEDRYVMLWKKEFAPSDEELLAYRKGEDWDPQKAKEAARLKELKNKSGESKAEEKKSAVPAVNYQDKYKHLIGDERARQEIEKLTGTNRSYGFVSADNKRDRRTIEEVLAETRARKRQKNEGTGSGLSDPGDSSSGVS